MYPVRYNRSGSSPNVKMWNLSRNPNNDLTGCIVPEGSHPVSGGSHGDIYRGTLKLNGRAMPVASPCRLRSDFNLPSMNVQVAIKVIKKYTTQGDDLSKQRVCITSTTDRLAG